MCNFVNKIQSVWKSTTKINRLSAIIFRHYVPYAIFDGFFFVVFPLTLARAAIVSPCILTKEASLWFLLAILHEIRHNMCMCMCISTDSNEYCIDFDQISCVLLFRFMNKAGIINNHFSATTKKNLFLNDYDAYLLNPYALRRIVGEFFFSFSENKNTSLCAANSRMKKILGASCMKGVKKRRERINIEKSAPTKLGWL